jgi:hypothetical protein
MRNNYSALESGWIPGHLEAFKKTAVGKIQLYDPGTLLIGAVAGLILLDDGSGGSVPAGQCASAHCANHGTGTASCVEHRAACPSNRAFSPTGGFGSTSSTITSADINNLRSLIRAELTRYNLHRDHNHGSKQSSAYDNETRIDNTHINEMEEMVNDTNKVVERVGRSYAQLSAVSSTGGDLASYQNEDLIRASHWNSLREKYNIMRQDCICNSDCACNLVCACHNDCGCNYSDIRLKENVKFLENKNGINWYSFNYVWNKNKKEIGVMAQELLNTKYKKAVSKDNRGYYMVNYSLLPN